MIRFLIGCLLAIAVLWSVALTVIYVAGFTGMLYGHRLPVGRAAP
jgi:hypothetical protein